MDDDWGSHYFRKPAYDCGSELSYLGTLSYSWLVDVWSHKYGNFIGFGPITRTTWANIQGSQIVDILLRLKMVRCPGAMSSPVESSRWDFDRWFGFTFEIGRDLLYCAGRACFFFLCEDMLSIFVDIILVLPWCLLVLLCLKYFFRPATGGVNNVKLFFLCSYIQYLNCVSLNRKLLLMYHIHPHSIYFRTTHTILILKQHIYIYM